MQYTYNIVEAAALWAGVELSEIRRRMELADNEKAEVEYLSSLERARQHDLEDRAFWLERLNICDFQCTLESTCPELLEMETEDGDRRLVLKCPQGFNQKPADNPPTSRVVTRPNVKIRLVPFSGEFNDLPSFEKRLGWLQAALNMGDLDGTPEVVRARDLRAWLQQNFPGQQPEFLFPRKHQLPQADDAAAEKIEHQVVKGGDENTAAGIVVRKLKNSRSDLLAPVIEGLIKEVGSDEASVIWPALFEMALDKKAPLNWAEGEVIFWRDSNGESQQLNYDALAGRLRRRRNRKPNTLVDEI